MSHTQEHPLSLYTHSPSNSFSSLLESFLPSQLQYKHQSPTIFRCFQHLCHYTRGTSRFTYFHFSNCSSHFFWPTYSIHQFQAVFVPIEFIIQQFLKIVPPHFLYLFLFYMSFHYYLSHILHPQHLCFSSPSA